MICSYVCAWNFCRVVVIVVVDVLLRPNVQNIAQDFICPLYSPVSNINILVFYFLLSFYLVLKSPEIPSERARGTIMQQKKETKMHEYMATNRLAATVRKIAFTCELEI